MEIKRGYVFFDDGRKEPLFLHPDLEATASEKQKAASERLKELVEVPFEPELQLTVATFGEEDAE